MDAVAMQSTAEAAHHPPWADLLPELLGRIAAACLPNPADRARFRTVCRSWHSAVRHHCPHHKTPLPPWVVFPDGSFLALSDGGHDLPSATLPFIGFLKPSDGGQHRLMDLDPESTACVGSTNGWLALCKPSMPPSVRSCGGDTLLRLHNPFSNKTVWLPDVDAICTKAAALGEWFHVVKVLVVHSTAAADDMVAVVMTQSRSYPLVLSMPGPAEKGDRRRRTWTPDPHALPFAHIINVAFLPGDNKLYGITKAEDLFSWDLSSCLLPVRQHDDAHVVPDATPRCERVIRHPLDDYVSHYVPFDDDHDYVPWSDDDDDDDDDDNEDGVDDEDENNEEEEDSLNLGADDKHLQVPCCADFRSDGEEGEIITIRYLIAERRKLIMVRRELHWPEERSKYTRKTEVFEADTEIGEWVPLGDCGGNALFVSKHFSRFISTSEYGNRLEEDAVYFIDTGDVFHMRSGTISPALWSLIWGESTWVFPPRLVT